jgi:hypothetical protein
LELRERTKIADIQGYQGPGDGGMRKESLSVDHTTSPKKFSHQ